MRRVARSSLACVGGCATTQTSGRRAPGSRQLGLRRRWSHEATQNSSVQPVQPDEKQTHGTKLEPETARVDVQDGAVRQVIASLGATTSCYVASVSLITASIAKS